MDVKGKVRPLYNFLTKRIFFFFFQYPLMSVRVAGTKNVSRAKYKTEQKNVSKTKRI